jgi:hypothetical protein
VVGQGSSRLLADKPIGLPTWVAGGLIWPYNAAQRRKTT